MALGKWGSAVAYNVKLQLMKYLYSGREPLERVRYNGRAHAEKYVRQDALMAENRSRRHSNKAPEAKEGKRAKAFQAELITSLYPLAVYGMLGKSRPSHEIRRRR